MQVLPAFCIDYYADMDKKLGAYAWKGQSRSWSVDSLVHLG